MTKHETFTENYKRYGAMIMKSVMAQTKDKELAAEILSADISALLPDNGQSG